MNIRERVAKMVQAKDAVKLAKAGKNHLAFVQSLRHDGSSTVVLLQKVEAHKLTCPGCTLDVIEEIRSRL